MNMGNPLTPTQLASTICTSIAIAITLLRLYIRRRTFWVDDWFAMLSMISLTTQLGLVLRSADHFKSRYEHTYLVISTFYGAVWCARIAILFTILRIGSGKRRCQILSAIVGLFVVLLTVFIGQLFWICQQQRRSPNPSMTNCKATRQMAIVQVVADIFADATLLVSSLSLFRVIQDNSLRHRLKLIFSACGATTVFSVVHVSFILAESSAPKVVIAGLVEGSFSLIVSSVPMVSNLLFKYKRTSFQMSRSHTRCMPSEMTIRFARNPDCTETSSLSESNTASMKSLRTLANADTIREKILRPVPAHIV